MNNVKIEGLDLGCNVIFSQAPQIRFVIELCTFRLPTHIDTPLSYEPFWNKVFIGEVREIAKVSQEYIRIPILLNANTLVYSNV